MNASLPIRLADPQDGTAKWIRAVWPRLKLDRDRVALFADLYREGGPDALPPITVLRHGRGSLLADGVHRVCAAWSLGWQSLPAVVLEPSPDRDPEQLAFLFALDQAIKGPLPLTLKERKNAALRLLNSEPRLSHRQIAKLVGVSHTCVSNWAKGEDGAETEDDGNALPGGPGADDLARALLRRLAKLERHRPFTDALFGDRMGKRLARAARAIWGDEAHAHVERYAGWWNEALLTLKTELREMQEQEAS